MKMVDSIVGLRVIIVGYALSLVNCALPEQIIDDGSHAEELKTCDNQPGTGIDEYGYCRELNNGGCFGVSERTGACFSTCVNPLVDVQCWNIDAFLPEYTDLGPDYIINVCEDVNRNHRNTGATFFLDALDFVRDCLEVENLSIPNHASPCDTLAALQDVVSAHYDRLKDDNSCLFEMFTLPIYGEAASKFLAGTCTPLTPEDQPGYMSTSWAIGYDHDTPDEFKNSIGGMLDYSNLGEDIEIDGTCKDQEENWQLHRDIPCFLKDDGDTCLAIDCVPSLDSESDGFVDLKCAGPDCDKNGNALKISQTEFGFDTCQEAKDAFAENDNKPFQSTGLSSGASRQVEYAIEIRIFKHIGDGCPDIGVTKHSDSGWAATFVHNYQENENGNRNLEHWYIRLEEDNKLPKSLHPWLILDDGGLGSLDTDVELSSFFSGGGQRSDDHIYELANGVWNPVFFVDYVSKINDCEITFEIAVLIPNP